MDYTLENAENILGDALFSGIYRDDGTMVKEGILTKHTITDWLNRLNKRVKCMVGSNRLKLTVEILDAGGIDDGVKLDGLMVCNKELFSYLAWISSGAMMPYSSKST